MADTVRMRVVSGAAPAFYDGQPTEFGLQDKSKALHPGASDGGTVVFTAEVTAREDPRRPGMARFGGPFVHGSPAQHLYVGWRWIGSDHWINRMKVALDIPWDDLQAAIANDNALEADASGPQWGVLKDWHGLGLGREWRPVDR